MGATLDRPEDGPSLVLVCLKGICDYERIASRRKHAISSSFAPG